MISNFHAASESPGSAYYTLAGFDNDVAAAAHPKDKKSSSNSKNAKPNRLRRPRVFGKFGKFGRGRINSVESQDSLTTSSVSSVQSAGESTNSSEFSEIMRIMEMEDNKKQRLSMQRGMSTVTTSTSGQSQASSLNYSDDDGESSGQLHLYSKNSSASQYSSDFSTAESELEGFKLIQE
jgi:hypothetical protein